MTPSLRLFAASTHMLFLELVLIRWLGSNVVHLAYFNNFVLLGSFLGIGLGFLRATRTARPPWYGPVVLAIVVALVSLFPVTIERESSEILFFTSLIVEGPPAWLMLPIIFLATSLIMTSAGQLVGAAFRELRPLDAYRMELLGSLGGIVLFTIVSWLGLPPVVWGSIVTIGYLVLLTPPNPPIPATIALMATVAFMMGESMQPGLSWSPYSKLKVWGDASAGYYTISGNGVPHQNIQKPDEMVSKEPIYASPYDMVVDPRYEHALIIGAGTGSDIALALSRGVGRIDAVEIDPGILRIGRDLHPNRPFQSDRVTTHVGDGRAFLRRSPNAYYDLVIFALPDSQTAVRGTGSLRLESYLFTREAFVDVRRVLKPNGAFAVYNYYREPWLLDRIAATVKATFGHEPGIQEYGSVDERGSAIVACVDQSRQGASDWKPQGLIVPPATDDRPFVYLRHARIPGMYGFTLLAILLVSTFAVRMAGGSFRYLTRYADLFLLGMAFLLIETKSITTFSLLFGTTWLVNALVFGGILLAILSAVEVTRRIVTPGPRLLYALLGLSLLLAWAIPNSLLLPLPWIPRLALAILLTFLPVFVANIIFSRRLSEAAEPTTAFAANLLGAMVGGCLEYAGLIVGYRCLILIAVGIYALAFVAWKQQLIRSGR